MNRDKPCVDNGSVKKVKDLTITAYLSTKLINTTIDVSFHRGTRAKPGKIDAAAYTVFMSSTTLASVLD